jgi:Fe-S oxidoreductase
MALTIDADEITDVKRNFEVLHASQYFNRLMDQGKMNLKNQVDLKVTYHDPCELARLAKPWKPGDDAIGDVENYENPRKLLQSVPGLELVEMDRTKECAYCCGSETGWAFPDFLTWTSNKRLEEAKATGAEAIVSWCPTCINNFKHAAKGQIKVFDMAELIQRTL